MTASANMTHVVFGASGAIGSAIAARLASRGEFVRAVVRDPEEALNILPKGVAAVAGDAMVPESSRSACRGASIVYDCVSVRHSDWEDVLPIASANILAASRDAGARLVLIDNAHSYGILQRTPATEDHPRDATTRKGRIRAGMEEAAMAAHRSGKVQVVIPRFPDFYGPNVLNPSIAPIFEMSLEGKTTTWPMKLDVPHNLIFVEDAAEAAILLGKTESAYGRAWHVPGAGALTGGQFLSMVAEAAGSRSNHRAVGRMMFRFFGLMIPDAGEMLELLYQFDRPFLLDGSDFARAFPDFRYTPHEEAIRKTIQWFRDRAAEKAS